MIFYNIICNLKDNKISALLKMFLNTFQFPIYYLSFINFRFNIYYFIFINFYFVIFNYIDGNLITFLMLLK